MGADPSAALLERRDAVLRRWLGIEVERASVGQLAERPLSERLRELEELFDAAVHELRTGHLDSATRVREEIEHAIERQQTVGLPFSLALIGRAAEDAERWLDALTAAAPEGAVVLDAGDGLSVALVAGVRGREADVAVDRLRAHAWSAAGARGPLPSAGRSSCPDDGDSPDALLDIARERLLRMSEASLDRSRFGRLGKAAPVTPLYPELE